MSNATDGKLGGPIHIDQSVIQRDSMIREDNDGDRIDDKAVRDYVEKNKQRIFDLQATFFAELKAKHNQLG